MSTSLLRCVKPLRCQLLSKTLIRSLSDKPLKPAWNEVKPETRQKNALTAVLLILGVGGVYYTAIYKMKETDDLEEMIEKETLTTAQIINAKPK